MTECDCSFAGLCYLLVLTPRVTPFVESSISGGITGLMIVNSFLRLKQTLWIGAGKPQKVNACAREFECMCCL